MSSFLLSPVSIAQLADYIDTLNFVGYDYFGYECPRKLCKALEITPGIDRQAKKIFTTLYHFNNAAVCQRYPGHVCTAPLKPKVNPIYHPRDFKELSKGQFIDQIYPWHYELLKKLQCYLYQCDEYKSNETELYKGLQELEQSIMYYIVSNNENYLTAKWE